MNTLSVKSVVAGILIGLTVYFGVKISAAVTEGEKTADIGNEVSDEVTQGVTQVTKEVTHGDTRSDTSDKGSDTSVAQVSPSVTPQKTSVITPWPTPEHTEVPQPESTQTPIPSPVPSPTPWPTATPTPSPIPTPVPTASSVPTPTPTPSETPTPSPETPARVVINEIAWMGTSASFADEWLELYNTGESEVNLSGWTLYKGETKIIELYGTIPAGSYFLIERTNEDTVSDIVADVVGAFGGAGLKNSPGEDLRLANAQGGLMDRVDCTEGWFAGDNGTKSSMERRDPLISGNDPGNWATNDGLVRVGADADGSPIQGTPKYPNSATTP